MRNRFCYQMLLVAGMLTLGGFGMALSSYNVGRMIAGGYFFGMGGGIALCVIYYVPTHYKPKPC